MPRYSFRISRLLLCGFLCWLAPCVHAQTDTVRVLFVGNSFTYFYNLPQLVEAMAKTQGRVLYTRQSTVGGSNLEQHWKGEKGTRTQELLAAEAWDYVVMNNHSTSAIDSPESFMEYGKKWVDRIRERGAEPVFMMTWAYASNPLMQPEISRMYRELSGDTDADFVACGPLFAEARRWRPDLELFFDDKHPSYTGTYLLGLAFLKYFGGDTVLDVPNRLTTLDHRGEKLYLTFMPDGDARFLRQLVEEFPINNKYRTRR